MVSKNRLISLLAGGSALALLGVTAVYAQVVMGTQDFSITVEEGVDTTPDAFALGGYNAPVSSVVTLGPIPLTGFNEDIALSVSGGGSPEYSLDGGVTFTSSPGTISPDTNVLIRASASASSDQNVIVSLTAGDVTEDFTISTTNAQLEQFVSAYSGPISSSSWQFITADISDHIGKTGRFLARYDRTGGFRGDLQFDDVTVGTQFWDLSSQSAATQWQRSSTSSGVSSYSSVNWQNIPTSGATNGLWAYSLSAGTGSAGTGVATGYTGSGHIFHETSGGATGRTWLRSPETTITTGDFSFALGALGTELGALDVFLYLPEFGSPLTTNYPVSVETIDAVPDSFVVSSASNTSAAEPGALISFDPVTVSGMDAGLSVNASISGGGSPEFRINGGSWGTSGSVENGDTIQVRMTASATYLGGQVATLSVSSVNTPFSVTTRALDPAEYTPDSFGLAATTSAPGMTVEETVTISGLAAGRDPVLRVSGSTAGRNAVFSVNGGAYSAAERTVTNGDTVTFRIDAALFNLGVVQLVAETLAPTGLVTSTNILEVTSTDADAVDVFSFNWTNEEAPETRSARVTNTVTLTGGSGFQKAVFLNSTGHMTGRDCRGAMLNGDEQMPIITNYQANEGPRLRSADAIRTNGTGISGDVWACHLDQIDIGVTPGDQIAVWTYPGPDGFSLRNQIEDTYTALCVGSVCAEVRHNFHDVGVPTDPRAADPFSISSRSGVAVGQTDVTSDPFTVSWSPLTPGFIPPNIPISISGAGNPEYRVNGGAWTSVTGWVAAGSTVEVRLDAAASHITTRTATLSVGTTTAPFSVTTLHDTTPDAFSFVSSVATRPNEQFESLPVVITGLTTSVPVSVSGEGAPQFSTNGGATWVTSGTVSNNSSVLLRLTTAGSIGVTRTATLDVNGVTASWSVETAEPQGVDLVGTFSAVNNSSASVPAYQAGDVFVAFAWVSERSASAPANASGWTQLGALNTGSSWGGRGSTAAYWVAPTSCAASCTIPTGNFGSNTDLVFYAVYRNAGTPVATTSVGGSRSLSYPANAAGADTARTLVFVGINNSGLTPTAPSGMTVARSSNQSSVGGTIRMFEKDFAPAFPGGSFSWGFVSANWLSFTVRIPAK